MGEVLYFSFGSNLLADRMAHVVPSPRRVTIAKLKDFQLKFGMFSPKWGGHMAQGAPNPGTDMWGQVYGISEAEWEAIKVQEAVYKGVFKAGEFVVETPGGDKLNVVAVYRSEPPQEGARPSPQYKKVIVDGAVECGLPDDYITWLRSIPDNGYDGQVDYKNIKTNFD